MTRFAQPYFLFLIFLIPLLWWPFERKLSAKFSNVNSFPWKKKYFGPDQWLILLRSLALICFIFALARPQSGKKRTEVTSFGVDMVLTIDTSRSMEAMDFRENKKAVNRLEVVKRVVNDFIRQRPRDRMGLVVFGEDAFTQCPLTLDHGILVEFLNKLSIGMAGDATAIGSAIGTGVKRLKDLKSKSKVIILLTDGDNTAGVIDPIKAAELAKSYDIKIYTIGVGKKGKVPFLVNTIFGKRYVYQEVSMNEEVLKKISEITEGKFFRAKDKTELENIYSEINKLEKTEVKVNEYTEYNELFGKFLMFGLIFLLLEVLLGQTWLRVLS